MTGNREDPMFYDEAVDLFCRYPWLRNQLMRLNAHADTADLAKWMETRVTGLNELRGHFLDSNNKSQIRLHKGVNDNPKMLSFRRRKHLSSKWTTTRYTIVFQEELEEELLELTDHAEQINEKTMRFGTFAKVVEYGRSVKSTLKELKDWAERESKNIRLLGVLRCVSTGQNGRLTAESYDIFPVDENKVD